jgi:hypothetical protein
MATWLDSVITGLQAPAAAPALSFVEQNYTTLLALDMDTVIQVLGLFKTGQGQVARAALAAKLTDPDVIIAWEQQNAQDCAAATKNWDAFVATAEKVAMDLLPVILKVGETIATGGLGAL